MILKSERRQMAISNDPARLVTSLATGMRSSLRILHPILTSPSMAFLALALAIMGPLLLPGRILTLDSPLALNWDTAGYFWGTSDGPEGVFAATYNSAPIALLLKALGFVFPFWVVEKMWLILLLWLCGVGAFRLPYLSGIGRYYAGIFYTVNPFTYVRFVSGQWGVLGAYALMPFAVTSFIHLLEEPRPRHAIKTVLFLTVIGFLQIHGLIITLLLLAILYLGRIVAVRNAFRSSLRMMILSVTLFMGVNLFWIIRFAMVGGGAVNNMHVGELRFFAASPPLQTLALRGFWQSAYLNISDLVPVWWLLLYPLLFLAGYGSYKLLTGPGRLWLALGLIAAVIVGVLLAAGPGSSLTEGLFRSLWEHIPVYRAFRDSHKFVALIALSYAYLGAIGLKCLRDDLVSPKIWASRLARIASGAFLVIPIIYALLIFGTWGQIRTSTFPTDWQEVRTLLDEDKEEYNLLVLPWEMYVDFPWLKSQWKRLANPAPNFFSQPTISGDNVKLSITPSNSSNPVSKYVESLLGQGQSVRDFGRLIAPLNAKYVVLFKAHNYQAYEFLREQNDLQLMFEGQNIILFRNSSPTAKAYTANEVIHVMSAEDYFGESSDRNPLEHLYMLGSGGTRVSPIGQSTGKPSAQFTISRINPVSYRVQHGEVRYLVFTLPQRTTRDGWEYRGSSDLLNLGMMPAFQTSAEGGTITFSRFYKLYLPTYVLALVSLLVAAFLYRRPVR